MGILYAVVVVFLVENLRDLTDYLILSFGDMKEKDPVAFSWITREHIGQVLADVFLGKSSYSYSQFATRRVLGRPYL